MTTITLMANEFQDHVGKGFDRSLSQPVVIPKYGRRTTSRCHTANTTG